MGKLLGNVALFALLGLGIASMPIAAQAQQRTEKWVDLHNKTTGTISAVYFSEPTQSSPWGSDVLGQDYIYPDMVYRVRINSLICMIDMKVRFTSGVEHSLRFNICTATHVDDIGTRLVVAG